MVGGGRQVVEKGTEEALEGPKNQWRLQDQDFPKRATTPKGSANLHLAKFRQKTA